MEEGLGTIITSSCGVDGCKENAVGLSNYCWLHTLDKEGYRKKIVDFIKSSKSNNIFLRKVKLDALDLRDLNFKFADLSQASIVDANLHGADFQNANLFGANFSNSDLSNANLNATDLTKADLSNARLWYANLKNSKLSEVTFHGADLWQANLYNARIWNTDLTNVKHLTKDNFLGKPKRFFGGGYKIFETDPHIAKEAYKELKRYFSSVGSYDEASWASFEEKRMDAKLMLKNRDIRYIPSLIMGLLCGYGEKSRRVVLSSACILLFYAMLYKLLNAINANMPTKELITFLDCLYFSIVIFTTLGLGDFIPKPNISIRLLVGSEAFLGAFMIGLFVFTLARKYSAR